MKLAIKQNLLFKIFLLSINYQGGELMKIQTNKKKRKSLKTPCQTTLFGVFPDGVVNVTDDMGKTISMMQYNGVKFLHNMQDHDYTIDKAGLRPGDFVALKYRGQPSNTEVLASNQAAEDIPNDWKCVSGQKLHSNGHNTLLICINNGEIMTFDQVVKMYKLQQKPHPKGMLWLNKNNRPVAVSYNTQFSRKNHNTITIGDYHFFHRLGLAVRIEEKRHNKSYYSCSHVIIVQADISNLHQDGWYPVAIKNGYIVWATGLYLYYKDWKWQLSVDPNYGPIGTRIFDASKKRFKRVYNFFKGVNYELANNDPVKIYSCIADNSALQPCNPTNKYSQYANWTPTFSGCDITMFDNVRCYWKQPKNLGTPRYYGENK